MSQTTLLAHFLTAKGNGKVLPMKYLHYCLTALWILAVSVLAQDAVKPDVANVAIYYSNDINGYLTPCG